MITKELVAATTQPIVLSVLAHGDDYAYSIIRKVKQISGGELEWTEGMLYPVLHRMEKEKLLAARWDSTDVGRPRRYYRLTKAGRRALVQNQSQWKAMHETFTKLWGPKTCFS
ncbi:MAG: helix-turn-helix transcriptional regulator [Pirellulaceae bacterium]|nr:helix-turn-helix transcriptional regulator [Planctomycetales bacterium]